VTVREFQLRPGTQDENAWKEAYWWRKLDVKPGDRVLDLGAHIGCFIERVALPAGAAAVLAVEPVEDNLALLRANFSDDPRVEIKQAALTNNDEVAFLYLSNTSTMNHSLHRRKGREAVVVPAVTLQSLMGWYPTVIKCDVEGSEYETDWTNIPDCVRAIGVEFHSGRSAIHAPRIAEEIMDGGFEPLDGKVRFPQGAWHKNNVFVRPF